MSDLVPTSPAMPQGLSGTPLERLRGLADQPAVRRTLPWLLGSAAIGAAVLAFVTLAPAPQRVLYTQLDDSERAGVVATLDTAGIDYTIDNQTGALSVPETELYRARMLVAADGGIAGADTGASLDSLPLGASRTLEGERLRGAREHELMLTIAEIDGVESVRVHLAEAQKSVFVREDAPPTASVMLRMARGRQLSDSQVAAIVNLVAGSVPGMSPGAVRVVDQQGRLLSDLGDGKNDRLELQGRFEDKLRAQLEQLLTPMLGTGNFTSEIQIELDLDELTSARESYDKDGALRSESQQSQSQAGGAPTAGGIPGIGSNTPPPGTTLRAGPPQGGPPATQPASPAVNAETSASRTYEIGREVAVSNAAPGRIKRLSVAVAISEVAMKKGKPADLEQVKALVSAAVGADPKRGDQITVLTRPFEPVADESAPLLEAPWFALMVRSVVALLALVLVLLLGVRPLVRALKREPTAGGDPALREARPGQSAAPSQNDTALLGRQVSLAQRIVEEKPDDALLALRQMLGKETA